MSLRGVAMVVSGCPSFVATLLDSFQVLLIFFNIKAPERVRMYCYLCALYDVVAKKMEENFNEPTTYLME